MFILVAIRPIGFNRICQKNEWGLTVHREYLTGVLRSILEFTVGYIIHKRWRNLKACCDLLSFPMLSFVMYPQRPFIQSCQPSNKCFKYYLFTHTYHHISVSQLKHIITFCKHFQIFYLRLWLVPANVYLYQRTSCTATDFFPNLHT